jgi:tetratricopeptide (TPR) repeat protein
MHILFLSALALGAPPPESSELSEDLSAVYIEAMASIRQGDHEKVSRLLAQVIEGAPTFDDAYRNRCAAERFLGRGDQARELCERAVAIEGSWVNHAALVRDALAATEIEDARRFADAATAAHPQELELEKLSCEVSLRGDDIEGLEPCIDTLDGLDGGASWAAFYDYVLHVSRGEREEAIEAMDRAVALDLPQRGRLQMAQIPLPPEPSATWVWVTGGLAGIAGLAGVALGIRRRRRT